MKVIQKREADFFRKFLKMQEQRGEKRTVDMCNRTHHADSKKYFLIESGVNLTKLYTFRLACGFNDGDLLQEAFEKSKNNLMKRTGKQDVSIEDFMRIFKIRFNAEKIRKNYLSLPKNKRECK